MSEENILMMREDLEDLEPILLPEGYELKTFAWGDEEKWVELMRSIFPESDWTVEKFKETFASQPQFDPDGLFFIIKEGEYVATALGWFDEPAKGDIGRVHWVGVKEEHRGKGLGRAVVLAVLHYLKENGSQKVILDTQEYRKPAIRLYESLGFKRVRVCERRPEYR